MSWVDNRESLSKKILENEYEGESILRWHSEVALDSVLLLD